MLKKALKESRLFIAEILILALVCVSCGNQEKPGAPERSGLNTGPVSLERPLEIVRGKSANTTNTTTYRDPSLSENKPQTPEVYLGGEAGYRDSYSMEVSGNLASGAKGDLYVRFLAGGRPLPEGTRVSFLPSTLWPNLRTIERSLDKTGAVSLKGLYANGNGGIAKLEAMVEGKALIAIEVPLLSYSLISSHLERPDGKYDIKVRVLLGDKPVGIKKVRFFPSEYLPNLRGHVRSLSENGELTISGLQIIGSSVSLQGEVIGGGKIETILLPSNSSLEPLQDRLGPVASSQPGENLRIQEADRRNLQIEEPLMQLAGNIGGGDLAPLYGLGAGYGKELLEDAIGAWFPATLRSRVNIGLGGDGDTLVGGMDFLYPVYDGKEHIVFLQTGINAFEAGRKVFYLGTGARYFPTPNLGVGLNAFYDHELKMDHGRWGVGTELFWSYLSFAFNYYAPTGSFKSSKVYPGLLERPAKGYDLRLEGRLPFYDKLGITVARESFSGGLTPYGTSGTIGKGQKNTSYVYGLRYTPVPQLMVEANTRDGKEFTAKVSLSISLDGKKSQGGSAATAAASSAYADASSPNSAANSAAYPASYADSSYANSAASSASYANSAASSSSTPSNLGRAAPGGEASLTGGVRERMGYSFVDRRYDMPMEYSSVPEEPYAIRLVGVERGIHIFELSKGGIGVPNLTVVVRPESTGFAVKSPLGEERESFVTDSRGMLEVLFVPTFGVEKGKVRLQAGEISQAFDLSFAPMGDIKVIYQGRGEVYVHIFRLIDSEHNGIAGRRVRVSSDKSLVPVLDPLTMEQKDSFVTDSEGFIKIALAPVISVPMVLITSYPEGGEKATHPIRFENLLTLKVEPGQLELLKESSVTFTLTLDGVELQAGQQVLFSYNKDDFSGIPDSIRTQEAGKIVLEGVRVKWVGDLAPIYASVEGKLSNGVTLKGVALGNLELRASKSSLELYRPTPVVLTLSYEGVALPEGTEVSFSASQLSGFPQSARVAHGGIVDLKGLEARYPEGPLELRAQLGVKSSNPAQFNVTVDPKLLHMESKLSTSFGDYKDPESGNILPIIYSCMKTDVTLSFQYRGQILENAPLIVTGAGLTGSGAKVFSNSWGEYQSSLYYDETNFDHYANDPYFTVDLGGTLARVAGPHLVGSSSCE
ncbi:MAG: inverse autotransporter beta domain-containing protein [Deltaproteobacteria bacterium]|nr:inverse autotransporter beta domain-containing protein [Deltaproteobacteria bacterium]